ncbi:MAG: hypothetical protein WCK47_07895 [bacterium]
MNKTYCVLCVLAGCLVWNATAQMADTVDKDMRMGPDYSYHSPTSQIPRQFQTDSAFHQGVPPPPHSPPDPPPHWEPSLPKHRAALYGV